MSRGSVGVVKVTLQLSFLLFSFYFLPFCLLLMLIQVLKIDAFLCEVCSAIYPLLLSQVFGFLGLAKIL